MAQTGGRRSAHEEVEGTGHGQAHRLALRLRGFQEIRHRLKVLHRLKGILQSHSTECATVVESMGIAKTDVQTVHEIPTADGNREDKPQTLETEMPRYLDRQWV